MTPRVEVGEDADDMYDSLVRLANADTDCTLDVGYTQCYTWSDTHPEPRRPGGIDVHPSA